MSDMDQPLVDTWRRVIVGEGKSWVLFEHGTCVIFTGPAEDLAARATALMQEWGPVVAGTPAGDFNVIKLQDDPGWVVTSHHPDILTYVSAEEFEEGQEQPDMLIGLLGRGKRHQDAEELQIVHIES
jgi:hypothetical protein